MERSFYAPARYRMSLPGEVTGIDGGIIFPAGITAHALVRRNLDKRFPHLKKRLLDPQLYLTQLSAHTCRKACAHLASYGWFDSAPPALYDSSKHDQNTWNAVEESTIHRIWRGQLPVDDESIDEAVKRCVAFQRQIGCEAVILPAPLTLSQSADYSTELRWMDAGLRNAIELAPEMKRYVSIAISDNALRNVEPFSNDLLSAIVDQVTARSPDGAYIVIEQSHEASYYCSHPNTIGALLRLCHELNEGGVPRIVVGPIGIAGLLAIAAGANVWTAGWYRSERRIKLSDFDQAEGRTVPTYYSQSVAGEFHLESDLDRATKAGFLSRIQDSTSASEALLTALNSGLKVGAVPEWQHRFTNVAAAREHFAAVCVRETERMRDLSTLECIRSAHSWLKDAEQLSVQISSLGTGFNPRTELRHQASWLKAFDDFARNAGFIP